MSYVLNVTHNGTRLFSTSRGSCKSDDQCINLINVFRDRFPVSEGYEVTIFSIVSEATQLDIFDDTLTAIATA